MTWKAPPPLISYHCREITYLYTIDNSACDIHSVIGTGILARVMLVRNFALSKWFQTLFIDAVYTNSVHRRVCIFFFYNASIIKTLSSTRSIRNWSRAVCILDWSLLLTSEYYRKDTPNMHRSLAKLSSSLKQLQRSHFHFDVMKSFTSVYFFFSVKINTTDISFKIREIYSVNGMGFTT